jgi:hypothetical protein
MCVPYTILLLLPTGKIVASYFPANLGFRFSLKALTPS